jgi:hypothetical protein
MSNAIEKSILFSLEIHIFWLSDIFLTGMEIESCRWSESAANRFFISQENDYPAFPGERQGFVNIGHCYVNIASRAWDLKTLPSDNI